MGENQKTGFLIKEGIVWKTWKKRLFVLKNEELYYSKGENSARLGVIPVSKIGEVKPVEYKKKKFCFSLETPGRTYYVRSFFFRLCSRKFVIIRPALYEIFLFFFFNSSHHSS
jgi:hypothetical protein